MGFIYKITNSENNKIYVGKTNMTLDRRFYFHKKYNSKVGGKSIISDAIKKYGEEKFEIVLIEEVDDSLLNDREIYWIKELCSKNPNGYNLTDGGDGCRGFKMSDEYKKELSKRMTGSGNNFYNKKHSDESKRIIGEKGRGRPAWNKGVSMSVDSKNKLSESIKRKWEDGDYNDKKMDYNDPIRLKKISDKLKGRSRTKDSIEKARLSFIESLKKKGKFWDDIQKDLLIKNYKIYSDKELRDLFFKDRSYHSVRSMRNKMGLKRR